MRKIYSRPETRLRAYVRPTKENVTNLPFFLQTRKTRRAGPIPDPVRPHFNLDPALKAAFEHSGAIGQSMHAGRES